MSSTDVATVTSNLQKLDAWLAAVRREIDLDDEHAFRALGAVLQTLRDRIPVEEASHLGAQLPLIVRGLYYDSWHPAGTPEKIRQEEPFFDKIVVEYDRPDADGKQLFQGVIRATAQFVTEGQLQQVKEMLPLEIQEQWPSLQEYSR